MNHLRTKGRQGFQREINDWPSQKTVDEERWLARRHKGTEMNENAPGTILVDCAVELHRELGPGLLETVYEVTLARAWSGGA